MDPTLTALNRFGMGARPGEPGRVRDPRGWLAEQLEGPPPLLRGGRVPTTERIGAAIRALREAQATRDEEARGRARRDVRDIALLEMGAALTARTVSDRHFVERLVAFWSNHLCVSTVKGQVAPLAGAYEREAIRPHVLGRFADMVLASARHPAMLVYLDNAQSVGPSSQAARAATRRGRRRGLNENYARELMELHTLGVEGGYAQKDVEELARVLTGWTVTGLGPRVGRRGAPEEPGFAFVPAMHEPGARAVLGRRYAEGGEDQGEAVIRSLCDHPSTARFIASKLVRHFVGDAPPANAVERVAAAFARSEGDLRETARALIHVPEAWDGSHRKIRTPQDWVIAALRGLDAREAAPAHAAVLQQLRQPLWAPGSPKGWGDTVTEWADSDALMNRAELASTLASRMGEGANPAVLARLADLQGDDPLLTLITDESIGHGERVALALASPVFQWR